MEKAVYEKIVRTVYERRKSWQQLSLTLSTDETKTAEISFYSIEFESKIMISNPYPPNGIIDVPLTPTLHVDVNSSHGHQMNITWKFYDNDIGSWYTFGDNNSVGNGTYYQLFSNATWYNTSYEWRIEVNDGHDNWCNETFIFTTYSLDSIPPTITHNFVGNLSDSGGPYFLPGSDTVAPDGYYTNASHQQENWMYINCTVTDSDSGVGEVWLHWLNETTWTNNSYQFINTGGNYYEFNTSRNITDIASGYNYSFDIWANDTLGNTGMYQWMKRGVDTTDLDDRIYIQLAGTPTNISYTPFYFCSAYYNYRTGYGSGHSIYNDDIMHHDQGPDGTITDTGYLLARLPTDNMEEIYCGLYIGYWFDETVTAIPDMLDNIYFHNWWYTISDTVSFGYGNTRAGIYRNNDRKQNFTVSNISARSNISYDGKIYRLEASLMNITSPLPFGDNNIYEFFISHYAPAYGDNPSAITNRSIMSFVIFNVPDNATLQEQDTDGDGLNDCQELYMTFTSPFIGDTDNDGISDYVEYLIGCDPNNYLDTAEVVAPIIVMESPIGGSFGHPLNPRLSVTVIHPANATMDVTFRTNASGPWEDIETNNSVHNGTYSQIPTDMDSYGTIYYWSVNCSDGMFWTNETYWFRTSSDYPFVSNPSPANGTVDVPISLSELSFNLTDCQGDDMNYTVETSPDIGNASGVSVDDGTYTVSVSDLHYNTVYTWYVNVTDPLGSGSWTNETFHFTTLAGPSTCFNWSSSDDWRNGTSSQIYIRDGRVGIGGYDDFEDYPEGPLSGDWEERISNGWWSFYNFSSDMCLRHEGGVDNSRSMAITDQWGNISNSTIQAKVINVGNRAMCYLQSRVAWEKNMVHSNCDFYACRNDLRGAGRFEIVEYDDGVFRFLTYGSSGTAVSGSVYQKLMTVKNGVYTSLFAKVWPISGVEPSWQCIKTDEVTNGGAEDGCFGVFGYTDDVFYVSDFWLIGGYSSGSHVTEWKNAGQSVNWSTLRYIADDVVFGSQDIVVTVQVSNDGVVVLDSMSFYADDGDSEVDISYLSPAQYVRVITQFMSVPCMTVC